VNWSAFESIEVIGIDEISLKRGHRDFVALLTTPTEQGVAILTVLKDRKQETVAASSIYHGRSGRAVIIYAAVFR
jgi:transposase